MIGYIAIKHAKYGKRILFLLLLLPTNIFLASQYSKDSYIISLIYLGLSTFVNCYMSKDKISCKNLLIIVLSFIFGSLSKAIYIPFILLILLLPINKFENKKQGRIIKLIIVLIFIAVVSTFVLPTVSSPSLISDIRGGNTSSGRQLALMFSQPISFAKMYIPYLFRMIIPSFFSDKSLIVFCNLGIVSNTIYYLLFATIIAVVFLGEKNSKKLPIKLKISLLLLILFITCLITVSMYLSFTPVASTIIKGVQERYFLPLFYALLLIFANNNAKYKISEEKYSLILVIIMGIVLYYSIYLKFYLPIAI